MLRLEGWIQRRHSRIPPNLIALGMVAVEASETRDNGPKSSSLMNDIRIRLEHSSSFEFKV